MSKSLSLIIAALFCWSSPLTADVVPKHLQDVRQLQENVLSRHNSYRHRDQIVTWRGTDGALKYICHADCSGLIDALLEHSYGLTKSRLYAWLGGNNRPLAKNYYRAIMGQGGFQRIPTIQQVRPGDLIAMEFLPGASDPENDTGHILVVDTLPQKIQSDSLQKNGMVQWSVGLIDCTSHGHGKDDSRYRNGAYQPGIGKGFFALYTDQNGSFLGYSWTTSPQSEFHGPDKRPLAVGRLAIN